MMNNQQRDLTIDLAKGIAILFVYFGHSIIYHPIDLRDYYHWCFVLERMVTSFNMPMFFIISGLLFGFSHKSNRQVLTDKMRRLLIPYLFTMGVIMISKFFLPSEMAKHKLAGLGGVFLKDIFLHGGDRWFVYVLFWIFVLAIPFRNAIKTKCFWLIVSISITITIMDIMPEIFLSWKICKYITFFFIGMYCSQYYVQIKNTLSRYVWMLTLFFIVFNLCLIDRLNKMPFVWDVVLPLIGSSLFFGVAIKIGKRKDGTSKVWKALVGYIEYCGKFSLQFYLLTFAYPIIRFVTVKFVSDPVLIVLIVFILQLIAVTILVEITRRIKYLRIPLGY